MELAQNEVQKYIDTAKKNGLVMTKDNVLFLWAFMRAQIRQELDKIELYAKQ